jgi:hypothetical protein
MIRSLWLPLILLLQPLDAQAQIVPDPSAEHRMFDRVINVRAGYSVPLGLRGTITAILSAAKERDVLYEVVFDDAFLGGLTSRWVTGSVCDSVIRVTIKSALDYSSPLMREMFMKYFHSPFIL